VSESTGNSPAAGPQDPAALKQLMETPSAGGPTWRSALAYLAGDRRSTLGLAALAAVVVGIGASLYHIYVPIVGAYDTFFLRPMHVLLLGTLAFVCFDIRGKRRDFTRFSWAMLVDFALLVLFVLSLVHILVGPAAFENRFAMGNADSLDTFYGAALTLLVIELSRRCIGLPIAVFVAVMLAYAFWGQNLFAFLKHRPLAVDDIFQYLYMTTFGIFGVPVAVMANYVFLFIIFGAFVERSRGGLLIQRLGLKVAGRSPGGPAKVAVLTSAMFGTLSGSALANVMATGSFTIPLMKRVGFKPHNAGAIEAAASSGGQIMPPIMGAVAFVMSDITGISYSRIIVAAALPAILYYLSLFMTIDITARREGMAGMSDELMPKKGEVLALAHLFVPIAVLVGALSIGYSPMYAAIGSIATTLVVAGLRRATRMNLKTILEGLNEAAQTTIVATVACAAAGLVVGIINQTGLGLRLSSQLINLSHGYVFAALLLVMATCVILGMGMPTVAAYVITVAIGAPVLEQLGVPEAAAHLFILYYAVLSLITPPVMVASFGAAALAQAEIMKTGFAAVRFAALAFIMPFIFVYNPTLLIITAPFHPLMFVWMAATAMCGVVVFVMAVNGYPARTLVERALLLAASYGLINPVLWMDAAGLAIAAIVLGLRYTAARRSESNAGRMHATGRVAPFLERHIE
jgi:TRAP transporter 4TM/12TM fusion protein